MLNNYNFTILFVNIIITYIKIKVKIFIDFFIID